MFWKRVVLKLWVFAVTYLAPTTTATMILFGGASSNFVQSLTLEVKIRKNRKVSPHRWHSFVFSLFWGESDGFSRMTASASMSSGSLWLFEGVCWGVLCLTCFENTKFTRWCCCNLNETIDSRWRSHRKQLKWNQCICPRVIQWSRVPVKTNRRRWVELLMYLDCHCN